MQPKTILKEPNHDYDSLNYKQKSNLHGSSRTDSQGRPQFNHSSSEVDVSEEVSKTGFYGQGQHYIDTLCWSCKRSCNLPDCNCSWSESFIPVDGWNAVPGRTYYLSDPLNPKKKEASQGYHVIDCPLYIRRTRFLDFKDVAKEVVDVLQISAQTFYRYGTEQIRRYEELTGQEIPAWAKLRAQNGVGTGEEE